MSIPIRIQTITLKYFIIVSKMKSLKKKVQIFQIPFSWWDKIA